MECARRVGAVMQNFLFVDGECEHVNCPQRGTVGIENVSMDDPVCNAMNML